jgi:hypothetical protein
MNIINKNLDNEDKNCIEQKIILDDFISNEKLFIIKMMELLCDADLLFIKSKNKFSKLDISIINQYNLKSVLIEVKNRDSSIRNYSDFCISKAKIDSFDTEYKDCLKRNCFIVFTFTDDSDLYYLNFNKKLKKKFRIGTMFQKSCYFIDKKFFKVGIKNLIFDIKSIIY